MTTEERERMTALSLQIQTEKNYEKFEQLIREVNDLIAAKERWFPESKLPSGITAHKLLHATATRTISSIIPNAIEAIEIQIADAVPVYAEIRIDNSFTDERGNVLALQPPAHLDMELRAPVDRFSVRPQESPALS